MLSSGPWPTIYYDGRMLYHKTDPDGCRYKCHFTRRMDNLTRGDVAVFSMWFDPNMARKLVKRGVIIAFESIESPVHVERIYEEQQNMVRQDP